MAYLPPALLNADVLCIYHYCKVDGGYMTKMTRNQIVSPRGKGGAIIRATERQ